MEANLNSELISVVVPVYNMGRYINRAVDSILKQTYRNFELVLVDDGSTDDCGAICDEYAQKHDVIRVIHKTNGGLSSARNAGIDHARGRYIIFPDPDDWVTEYYLENLISLKDTYHADLEVCGHYVTDGKQKRIHNENNKVELLTKDQALRLVLLPNGYCGFAWNKLYHMDIIQSHGLRFDEELGMAQDLHFAFRYILIVKNIAYNPAPVYFYYQHEKSITNTKMPLTDRKISALKTYEKIAEIAEIEFPEAIAIVNSTIANISMHFMYIYYDSRMDNRELLQALRKNFRKFSQSFFSNISYSLSHKILGFVTLCNPYAYYLLKKKFSHY